MKTTADGWNPGTAWRRLRRTVVWLGLAGLAGFLLTLALVRLHAPPASFLLYDRDGGFLAEAGADPAAGYGYWPLEQLPPRVVAATLALEDRRFWSHPGVDPLALGRALRQNLGSGRRISGASTIAMQVARLQAGSAPRSYPRKIWESWLALALTLRYGREAVLRHYLSLVPYGNRAHGIAYAARRYFDKPVADLSWAEIALLAAIPQAPSRMNPLHPAGLRRAVARGQRILLSLRQAGLLDPAAYELARVQLQQLRIREARRRPVDALHLILQLERELERQRPALIAAGRFVLRTGVDPGLQRRAARLARQTVAAGAARGLENVALVVVEPADNTVRAWLGSADYFQRGHAGAMDFAARPRSPGSTLKPFLYAQALERGVISAASVLDDLPGGAAGLVNADRAYLGPLLPRQALANSRNIPAALLLRRLGVDAAYGFLRELGLHRGELPARHYGLGLSVGALPVRLAELVRAYGVLAHDGRLRPLRWFEDGPPEDAPAPRLLSLATVRQVSLFLADPISRLPSFPRMGASEYPFPVAVKTGTSQGHRDAWTLAYSRRYLVGVWLGNAAARPMSGFSGANSAAALAQSLLMELHPAQRAGLEDLSFPPPPGYQAVRLCALSGRRATPACGQVFEEWLPPGGIPLDYDEVYLNLAVDRRDGLLAHSATPPEWLDRRTFLNLPPRYAEWAVSAGLPLVPESFSPLDGGPRTSPRPLTPQAATPRLSIVSPEPGLRLVRDPEAPPATGSLALRVVAQPRVEQVLWLVDGQAFQLAAYPYTVRWPLSPGEHRFQAHLPYSGVYSQTVRVRVE